MEQLQRNLSDDHNRLSQLPGEIQWKQLGWGTGQVAVHTSVAAVDNVLRALDLAEPVVLAVGHTAETVGNIHSALAVQTRPQFASFEWCHSAPDSGHLVLLRTFLAEQRELAYPSCASAF
jgi:hypothetical protein